MHKFTKKTLAVATAAALLAAGGGTAYDYWTAGGAGSGTSATGTTVPIAAMQTNVLTPIAPGDSAQSLSGTFLNDNTGPVYVATVTASIASVVKDPKAVDGTCDASDFILTGAVMSVRKEALADDTSPWAGATLQFNNKADANQDQCKLAKVNIAYVIS
jgi:hypothetical protein